MNQAYKLLTILFIVLLSCSTTQAKKSVTLKGKIENFRKGKDIVLREYGRPFNLDPETTIKVDEEGNYSLEFEKEIAQYYLVIYNRRASLIYLAPEDELAVNFDARKFPNELSFEGPASELNKYLNDRFVKDQSFLSKGNAQYLYKLEFEEFYNQLNSYKDQMAEKLETFKKDKKLKKFLKEFIQLEQANYESNWAAIYLQYPSQHAHHMKKNALEIWKNVDINTAKGYIKDNELLLEQKAFRDLMNHYAFAYADKTLNERKAVISSRQEFVAATYSLVPEAFDEVWMQDYVKARLLYEQIDKHGITGMQECFKDFVNEVKYEGNEHYHDGVELVWNKWVSIMPGAEAPDIVGKDIEGNVVKLSDFKGKVVYIDVWATWCGPCRQQIPFLKEVEKQYHGKDVVFMSVSTDNDKKKWEQFVEKESLTGVQIHQVGGWQSEICKKYNISGIPRFMLVDKEGKIVTTSAIRPSQGISSTLNELLEQ